MNARIKNLEKSVMVLGGLILLTGFVLSGMNCFWADSEIWHLKISIIEGDAALYYDYWIKPLFLLMLKSIYLLSETIGVGHLDLGRFAFSINGLIILFLGSRIVVLLKGKGSDQAFFLLFVGSSWLFLERGFRIRSDMLAVSVFLTSLYLTLSWVQQKKISTLQILTIFVLFIVTIFITPKSLVYYLCFTPVWWRVYQEISEERKNFVVNIFLLGLSLFIGISMYSDSFLFSLLSQRNYLTGSLIDSRGQLGVFRWYRYEHVIKFIYENPIIIFAVLVKLIWIIKNQKVWLTNKWSCSFDCSILLLIPALIVFPNRTPFFICSLVPLLFLVAFNGEEFNKWKNQKFLKFRVHVQLIVIASIVAGTFKVYKTLKYHNNFDQRAVYFSLEGFTKTYPHKVIFDPMGLSPAKNALHFYFGPGDLKGNKLSSKSLMNANPDIILKGQRFLWTNGLLSQDFLLKYQDFDKNGVLYRGVVSDEWSSRRPSKIPGMIRISFLEILQDVKNDIDFIDPIFLLPVNADSLKIPGVIFELKDGTAFTQKTGGVISDKALSAEYIHVSKDAKSILVFNRTSSVLGELEISKLIRFDPEM